MSDPARPIVPRPQRRGRSIAMTADEVGEFLRTQRTCRVASVDGSGAPRITPLWFVWDGTALWLSSLIRSQRWANLARDGRIAIVVDAGEDYGELRGVEIVGTARAIGDAPRTDTPDGELDSPERLFADKYAGGQFHYDGRHAWLKIKPDKLTSWDFRKSQALRPPAAT